MSSKHNLIGLQKTIGKKPEVVKLDFSKGEEYNKSIQKEIDNLIKEYQHLDIKPNHAIVKLFKYEGEMKSEGGIIVEDFDVIQTEGGQLKSRINTNPYQTRGVVLNVSSEGSGVDYYEKIIPGTVVHLMGSNFAFFKLDKTKKGQDTNGVIFVNLHAVEAIEKR